MTPRSEVYAAIDSERDYQAQRWQDRAHSIDEFALYIADYSARLCRVCSTTDDPSARLDFVRKMGGLAVACMEQHGAPKRA